MKRFFRTPFLLATAMAFILGGCLDNLETPATETTSDQLGEAKLGEMTLGEN